MSSKVYPVIAVVLLLTTSVSFAVEPAPETDSKAAGPYQAIVIGKGVDVLAKPKANSYSCVKVSAPDQLTVVSTQDNWAKIIPPIGSFSWISKDYVKVDDSGLKTGMVTGNSVRVYAGAEGLSPLHSPKQQTSLNQGELVVLLGAEKEGYYKIAPPVGAYLWINLSNIKYSGAIRTRPIKPNDFSPIPLPKLAPTVKIDPLEFGPIPPKPVMPDFTEFKPILPKPVKPVPAPVIVKPVPVTNESVRLEECYALKDKIETEKQKDVDQQDYSAIVEKLEEIMADENSGKAKRYAEYVMGMVTRFMLAVEAGQLLKQQDEELAKQFKAIEEKYLAKTSRIPITAKYTVSGTLKKSHVYTAKHSQQRFLIIDKLGKITCYALPANDSAKNSALGLLGKKVGIKGSIGKDKDNAVTVVSFDDIADLTEE